MYRYYPFYNDSWFPPSQSYYAPIYSPRANPYRQYPQVNPSTFMSSAQNMKIIMRDASALLNKMADSREFSYSLMSAAQESNQQKMENLVKSAGIQTSPKVTYNPDGLKLSFTTQVNNVDCCHLTLDLRWR